MLKFVSLLTHDNEMNGVLGTNVHTHFPIYLAYERGSNGVLGLDSTLEGSTGFCYESCPWCRIDCSTNRPAVQRDNVMLRNPTEIAKIIHILSQHADFNNLPTVLYGVKMDVELHQGKTYKNTRKHIIM